MVAPAPKTVAPQPASRQRLLEQWAASDEAPWLHREVARRMAERLPIIRQPPAAWLDWQAHAGGSAAAVQAIWPRAARWVAEPLPALLARHRAAGRAWWPLGRREPDPRVQRLEADWQPGEVQMLWANMVLHNAADPPALLRRWQALLAADGFLMFSTLGPQTLLALHEIYAASGWGSAGLGFIDMHDIGDALVQSGFADPVMDQESLTLSWSSPEAALNELRGLGRNLAPDRFAGLRSRRWLLQLKAALAGLAGPDGRIALSFELVYGHAYKGQARRGAGEPVSIPIDRVGGRRAVG